MIGLMMDRLVRRPARWLYGDYMHRGGINNTMRVSKAYNRVRYAGRLQQHRSAYEHEFDELLRENRNGVASKSLTVIRDGYAIDISQSLPYLQELLDQSEPLIRERQKIKSERWAYPGKPFFQNMLRPGDLKRQTAILDFILSSQMLEIVGRYIGMVPVLSETMPPGVRFVESYMGYEDDPVPAYRSSQLYHLDIHDSPLVYVIVLLHDTTFEHGPWCFLPQSVSDSAAEALGYRRRGSPYRVTDERMYEHVDAASMIPFMYPRGTVLFIDSSLCFHYGSRNCVQPRHMMMYAFTSPVRADLTKTYMAGVSFPASADDSRLRRMVLGNDVKAKRS